MEENRFNYYLGDRDVFQWLERNLYVLSRDYGQFGRLKNMVSRIIRNGDARFYGEIRYDRIFNKQGDEILVKRLDCVVFERNEINFIELRFHELVKEAGCDRLPVIRRILKGFRQLKTSPKSKLNRTKEMCGIHHTPRKKWELIRR